MVNQPANVSLTAGAFTRANFHPHNVTESPGGALNEIQHFADWHDWQCRRDPARRAWAFRFYRHRSDRRSSTDVRCPGIYRTGSATTLRTGRRGGFGCGPTGRHLRRRGHLRPAAHHADLRQQHHRSDRRWPGSDHSGRGGRRDQYRDQLHRYQLEKQRSGRHRHQQHHDQHRHRLLGVRLRRRRSLRRHPHDHPELQQRGCSQRI